MNDALKNILNRNSPRELSEPHPSKAEMKTIYQAALRAPDHAWLRPSKFIQGHNSASQFLLAHFRIIVNQFAKPKFMVI